MAHQERTAPRATLGVLFLIVFVDISGFSILFPLFPSLLEHYLGAEGEGSAVAGLVAWLQQFAGEDANAVVTLFGAALGSLYAVAQFLCAPFWGALSDRIGRRPTLLFTLVGTLIAQLLWMWAGSFAALLVSRLLAGAMAGNIATAAAAAADISSGRDRAKAMGIIGMGIGLGFIAGPALGGITAAEVLRIDGGVVGTGALGLHPFSTPALAAGVLALVNLVWVATRLPETRPLRALAETAGRGHMLRPFRALARLGFPGVARVHLIYFLYLTVFAGMEFTLTFLAAERLEFVVADITWMFVYTGFVIALVQGGLVRRVVPAFGERLVARVGLALLVPAFVVIGYTGSTTSLYVGLTLLALGSGLVMPALSALVSRYVPKDRQGLAQGTLRSLGSLSRAVGPLLGGVLYWKLGSAAPYTTGAVLLLVPLALSLRLPPARDEA